MSNRKAGIWVAVAAVVALVLGFSAGWIIQDRRVAETEAVVSQTRDELASAKQDLAARQKALDTATAERDRLQAAAEEASAAATIPTPTRTASPKPPAFSGKIAAYVKDLSKKGGTTYVTYDQIQFLTGKAAAAAATAHGDESPPPNDYYIVNDNSKLRTYPLSPSVKVTMTTTEGDLIAEGYPTTLAKLRLAFSGSDPTLKNAKDSPYWITIKNDVVTAITEQYVP